MTESIADRGQAEWRASTRAAFRFACVWFVLICFPSPFVFIPGLNILAAIYGEISAELAAAVARVVFGISVVPAETGSTDRAVDWYLLGFFSVISVLATLVWSWRTEKRDHTRLYDRLRTYLRYTLGSAMFTYAAIKIVKIQFPDPDVDWLLESYGASSPYRLLWMFMGHSRAYGVFVGCVELVGAFAVLFRRTVTIGALLLLGALSNVVMINLCYDVPVKLWSIQLLLMSAFLLLPESKRLADVFFFNRATDAIGLRPPAPPSWKTRARPFIKAAFIGCALFSAGQTAFANRTPPLSPLYGFYEVTAFVAEGRERPPSLLEPTRWRSVAVGARQRISIRLMDDSTLRFRGKVDPEKKTLSFSERREVPNRREPDVDVAVLTYSPSSPGALVLEGTFQNTPIQVHLQKAERKFLLLERGFHWVSEAPFNR